MMAEKVTQKIPPRNSPEKKFTPEGIKLGKAHETD
jgi:hypothetical protein